MDVIDWQLTAMKAKRAHKLTLAELAERIGTSEFVAGQIYRGQVKKVEWSVGDALLKLTGGADAGAATSQLG